MISTPRRLRLLPWLLVLGIVLAALALRRVPPDRVEAEPRVVPVTQEEEATGPPPPALSSPQGCYLGVAVADAQIDVPSRLEGIVRTVAVAPGQTVRAGQVLARLEAEELRHELASQHAAHEAAQADLRRATLHAELAEHTHRRKAALTDILSKEHIEESRYAVETAKLEMEAAAARLRQVDARRDELESTLSRAELRAPFDAVVGKVYAEPGALATHGTPIVRLIGTGGRVRFALPPNARSAVPKGTAVRVTANDLGHEATATVVSVAPEIDPESQMLFAEAAFDGEAGAPVPIPVGAVVRVAPEGASARCHGKRLAARSRELPETP